MAAFLWQEAAACCATQLEDVDAAAGHIDSSLRLFPDQRATRLQALLIQESRGDQPALDEASGWFLTAAPEDPAFVAHEVRRALSNEDVQRAIDTLRDAAARYPDSDYARAALDVALIRSAAHAERAERLRERGETAEGEALARLAWHAAQLTAVDPAASTQAQSLYSEASGAATTSKERILREALGAALLAKQPGDIIERCDELMQCDIEPTERATLAFSRYDVTQNLQGAAQEAELLLRDALEDPNSYTWAPHVARAQPPGRAVPTCSPRPTRRSLSSPPEMHNWGTCARQGRPMPGAETGTRPSASFDKRCAPLPTTATSSPCSRASCAKAGARKTWCPWRANGPRVNRAPPLGSSRFFSPGQPPSGVEI